MGSKVSKHYLDLSPKRAIPIVVNKEGKVIAIEQSEVEKALKGTTALAFFTKEGEIVVAVDSRASSEVGLDTFILRDNYPKAYELSDKIIAIQVGNCSDCAAFIDHLNNKFPHYSYQEDKGPRVSDVAETAYQYLMSFSGQKKGFGILLAGWDPEGDNQIYRLYIGEGHVVKEKVSSLFGVLGSGRFYAITSLKKWMFTCDNIEVALKAIFHATFYDRATGGYLRAFIVGKGGVRPEPPLDPLEAYSRYYDLYDQETTLFLIAISARHIPPISDHKLIKHFRGESIRVLAAHCVAHREHGKQQRLSFHRIIFNSKVGASKAYKLTASAHNDNQPQLLSAFPNQLSLTTVDPSVKLYLNRSSKHLLEIIRRHFHGYLTERSQMAKSLGD